MKLQEELDEFAGKVNEHCHARVTASYRYESFRGHLTAGGNYGLEQELRGLCTAALSAIRDVCLIGDMQKEAVAGQIAHVECDLGVSQLALDRGLLTAVLDPAAGDYSTQLRAMTAFVENSL
jgi:hypothetical protein